jgi:cysteine-rich repeat protein
VCGNGIIEAGETCDDGNTVSGDTCPASCRIEPCTPAGTTRDVDVFFVGANVAGITVFTDYPDGRVAIPGFGGASSVSSRILNKPASSTVLPNDLDYALRVGVIKTTAIAQGRLFTVRFDNCQGATPPTSADFPCVVEDASDSNGNPIAGATCSVTAP